MKPLKKRETNTTKGLPYFFDTMPPTMHPMQPMPITKKLNKETLYSKLKEVVLRSDRVNSKGTHVQNAYNSHI